VSHKFSIEVTSAPDHDQLVGEVWVDEDLFAELIHEPDGLKVRVYPLPGEKRWELSFDELVGVLARARDKLGPPGPPLD
jgi:hypothetical protein